MRPEEASSKPTDVSIENGAHLVMTDRLPTSERTARRRPLTGRLLTQQQAAALAGCSRDTVVRARRAGRFPHARLVDGRWMIPVDDLDEAGFSPHDGSPCAPPGDAEQVDDETGPARASVVLARAEARIVALEDVVTRQDAELVFLRRLAAETFTKRAS